MQIHGGIFALLFLITVSATAAAPKNGVFDVDTQQTLRVDEDNAAGHGDSVDMSVLAALKDDQTSIVRAAPKCENTRLRGMLVLETPRRPGFPFDATTFSSASGTWTSVTSTGDESAAVIQGVGQFLNARAKNFVTRLLQTCSL